MNATTVAVDLAKSAFQLAVADASWRVIDTIDHHGYQGPPRTDRRRQLFWQLACRS